jgi:hypothetical protein
MEPNLAQYGYCGLSGREGAWMQIDRETLGK